MNVRNTYTRINTPVVQNLSVANEKLQLSRAEYGRADESVNIYDYIPHNPAATYVSNINNEWNDYWNLTAESSLPSGIYLIIIKYSGKIFTGLFTYMEGNEYTEEIPLFASGTGGNIRIFARVKYNEARTITANSQTYSVLAGQFIQLATDSTTNINIETITSELRRLWTIQTNGG